MFTDGDNELGRLIQINRRLWLFGIPGIFVTLMIVNGIVQRHWVAMATLLLSACGLIILGLLRQTQQEKLFCRMLEDAHQRRSSAESFIRSFTQCMAGIQDGDLTTSVAEVRRNTEYEAVAEALECTRESFVTMLRKIQRSSADVSAQARRIQETAGDQASGSSEQAAAVAQITSAMEELARTAAQIAENTAWVVQCSEEAEVRASDGMKNMRASTGNLERMNDRMNEINTSAHHLGEKFQEIDKILGLITSIASETHILALNAAIEAASAGEFGTRFGVIATEVRRLSDMSQDAVDEIKKILSDFRRSIQSTILATEHGTREFENAMSAAFTVSERLEAIVDKVGQTTRSAKEIMLATQQQKTASCQIVETLKDVSTVIKQIAKALGEFKLASNRLDTLSMELQLISQDFTIESDRNIKFLARSLAQSDDVINYRRHDSSQALQRVIQERPYIEMVYIIDLEGGMVAYAIPDYLRRDDTMKNLAGNIDYAQRPWFRATMESERPYLSSMYKSCLTHEDCFTISVPVIDANRQKIGVLGIDINTANWTRIE